MSEGIKRGQVVGSTVREALTAIIDDIGAVSYTHLTLPTTPYV